MNATATPPGHCVMIYPGQAGEAAPPRKGHWMLTFSGQPYWPCDPSPADVRIRDIAHALSMLCRYTGHVRKFYSVAEHSVLVSYMVRPELAFQALMHDATEAYLGDVNRPVKVNLPEYQRLEAMNAWAICERFGIEHQEHPDVKQADTDILRSECEQLLPPNPLPWTWGGTYHPEVKISGWPPEMAEIMFLDRFTDLGGLGR